jgi:two-component system, cell cycle response regulator DivK
MMKLLLAEDDPHNRDMLSRRLHRRGYEVLATEDGQQAVERTLNESPDLILMDIAMPVLNGWQAMERIRSIRPHLPIIVLSAHSLADDRERALASGACAYLSKPVDFDLLLQTIARHAS